MSEHRPKPEHVPSAEQSNPGGTLVFEFPGSVHGVGVPEFETEKVQPEPLQPLEWDDEPLPPFLYWHSSRESVERIPTLVEITRSEYHYGAPISRLSPPLQPYRRYRPPTPPLSPPSTSITTSAECKLGKRGCTLCALGTLIIIGFVVCLWTTQMTYPNSVIIPTSCSVVDYSTIVSSCPYLELNASTDRCDSCTTGQIDCVSATCNQRCCSGISCCTAISPTHSSSSSRSSSIANCDSFHYDLHADEAHHPRSMVSYDGADVSAKANQIGHDDDEDSHRKKYFGFFPILTFSQCPVRSAVYRCRNCITVQLQIRYSVGTEELLSTTVEQDCRYWNQCIDNFFHYFGSPNLVNVSPMTNSTIVAGQCYYLPRAGNALVTDWSWNGAETSRQRSVTLFWVSIFAGSVTMSLLILFVVVGFLMFTGNLNRCRCFEGVTDLRRHNNRLSRTYPYS